MPKIDISDFTITEDDMKSGAINNILRNLSRVEVISASDGRVHVITDAKYIVFSVQDDVLKIFID